MSTDNTAWNMEEYRYHLPAERIAQRPLADRDSSRLLVVRADTMEVSHHTFAELPQILAQQSGPTRLVLNQTKVVAARIPMCKPTGGAAEILLNEPVFPSQDPQVALASTEPSVWECMVGGRNIQPGSVLTDATGTFHAEVLLRDRKDAHVRLTWSTGESLSAVIDRIGHVPLPPYIVRPDDELDRSQYQTVFARFEGSAAAPTAGLHFTSALLDQLTQSGIHRSQLTLHVGMVTFRHVEAANARQHRMHQERVEIDVELLDEMLETLETNSSHIIPVGTTSMRSIESAYWLGIALLQGHTLNQQAPCVQQFVAVDVATPPPPASDALHALRTWMMSRATSTLAFETQLMLAPGAHIGLTGGLITNFHQPGSTLILLVASLLGRGWRHVYQVALDEGYRFLSYGDAMLITRSHAGDVATT